MRKGFALLAPFALVAGLHVACSSSSERSSFDAPPSPSGSSTSFGTAPPPPKDAGQGCSESKTEIARIPVVIQFLVDESGSMSGDKWKAESSALVAVFNDMVQTADPSTLVGVTLFDDSVNTDIQPDSMANASHAQQVINAVKKPSPSGGGTETLGALQSVFSSIESFKAPANAGFVKDQMKRIVVLVSDGVPNGGADAQKSCEQLTAQKFGEQPPNGPILTFAVGVGPFPNADSFDYDPSFMGRIAQKGGTAPAGCNPASKTMAGVCHFQVTPGQSATTTQQAFIDAFNKIRALSASCEFEFTINDQTDLSNVKVEITDKDGNKTPIDKDPDNGWSFDDDNDPTKIVLHGDACSASSGTISGRVDVVVGCKGAN